MIVVYLMPCANMQEAAALISGQTVADVHACSLRHWDGVPIRSVGHVVVRGVFANGSASIAEIYRMAGIPAIDAKPVLPYADRAEIYCPGPSMADAPPPQDGAAVIAINRAAEAVASDYWLCLDPGGFPMFQGIEPRICHVSRERIAGRNTFPLDRAEMPHKAGRFSTTAAIVFALHDLHAKKIVLHGCDMSGAADFTGAIAGGRSADRWKLERQCLRDLIAYASDMDAHVVVHKNPPKGTL